MAHKSLIKLVYDFMFAPMRLAIFPDGVSESLGLTSLREERISAVFPHLRGIVLDIGCGDNELIRRYGDGTGVDVHDWGGGAMILEDTTQLPFADESFDTVTLLACLNHIPHREKTVQEAVRTLNSGGQVIVTMINPVLGWIGHRIWWYSEDKHRDTDPGELDGMWNNEIINVMASAGLQITYHKRFVYGMNNLFVFKKG